MTIVEFLLARIAEDEAELGVLASGVHDDSAGPNGLGWGDVGAISDVLTVSHRRATAECEAKRRIIDASRYVEAGGGSAEIVMFDGWPRAGVPSVLASLALPYADHPDFDPAWRS